MEVIGLLIGLVAAFGGAALLALQILGWLRSADEEGQEAYTLRLRGEAGWKEFRQEFEAEDVPNSVLRATYDLLWLDVIWARPSALERDTRLDQLYESRRRFEDVVRALAARCGISPSMMDSVWNPPETVGGLVDLMTRWMGLQTDLPCRTLLRPAEGALLRSVTDTRPDDQVLMRPATPEFGRDGGEGPRSL